MITAKSGIWAARPSGLSFGVGSLVARRGAASSGRVAIPHAAENHAAGGGLQGAGDGELDLFVEMPAALFHYDHRSIVEIPNALARFFAALHQADVHLFTGQDDGFEGVG